MKTPWFLLYRAGDRIGDRVSGGSFASSKLIGLLYLVVVFGTASVIAGVIRFLAPGSAMDMYVRSHFDAIFVTIVISFIVYIVARGFWDAFWDAGTREPDQQD